jgi:hypothetical protein
MNIIARISSRRVRNTLVAVAGAGLARALGLGGVAHAAPNGYVVVASCSTVAGQINYWPGLFKTKGRSTHAVLTGTTAGCRPSTAGRSPVPARSTPSCRVRPAWRRRTSPATERVPARSRSTGRLRAA